MRVKSADTNTQHSPTVLPTTVACHAAIAKPLLDSLARFGLLSLSHKHINFVQNQHNIGKKVLMSLVRTFHRCKMPKDSCTVSLRVVWLLMLCGVVELLYNLSGSIWLEENKPILSFINWKAFWRV